MSNWLRAPPFNLTSTGTLVSVSAGVAVWAEAPGVSIGVIDTTSNKHMPVTMERIIACPESSWDRALV